jgi:hypothetical protein
MPDGSPAQQAYDNAGWQWAQIVNEIGYQWVYNDQCFINLGNGRNETALVDPSKISGNLGLTSCRAAGPCLFPWDHQHFSECDIKISNQLNFSPQDESWYNFNQSQQGRGSLVHEFGHFLGLNHNSALCVMNPNPVPVAGGNTSEPFPDDFQGARFLYAGRHTNTTNLFVAAVKYNGGIVATAPGIDVNYCRGQSFTVTVTVGNNGPTDVSGIGFRVFLDTPFVFTGGWDIWVGTAYMPSGAYFTQDLTVTIPNNLPNGRYWIEWQIDTTNLVQETNEGDNIVHNEMAIDIGC